MQLLKESRDRTEIDRMKELLDSNGIPVRVELTDYRSIRYSLERPHNSTLGIFVCFDEQYEDAVSLLKDPHHIVTQKIDVSKYYRGVAEPFSLSLPFLIAILGGLLFVAFIFYQVVSHIHA